MLRKEPKNTKKKEESVGVDQKNPLTKVRTIYRLMLSKKLDCNQMMKLFQKKGFYSCVKYLKKNIMFTLKYVKEIVFFRQIYFVIQKLGYNIARYTVVAYR